jgi:hypothetical protein
MNSEMKPQATSGCFERELLMAYATRLLDPAAASKVEAHLAGGCEACRAVVNEYRTLDSVLEEWKPAEPSPWFDARLRAALAVRAPRKRGFLGFDWGALTRHRWLAPALAAALVVAVSVVAVRVHRTHVGSAIAQETQPSISQSGSQSGGAATGTTPAPSSVQSGSEEAGAGETAQQAAEDDEMLSNFDILSELPAPPQGSQVDN